MFVILLPLFFHTQTSRREFFRTHLSQSSLIATLSEANPTVSIGCLIRAKRVVLGTWSLGLSLFMMDATVTYIKSFLLVPSFLPSGQKTKGEKWDSVYLWGMLLWQTYTLEAGTCSPLLRRTVRTFLFISWTLIWSIFRIMQTMKVVQVQYNSNTNMADPLCPAPLVIESEWNHVRAGWSCRVLSCWWPWIIMSLFRCQRGFECWKRE